MDNTQPATPATPASTVDHIIDNMRDYADHLAGTNPFVPGVSPLLRDYSDRLRAAILRERAAISKLLVEIRDAADGWKFGSPTPAIAYSMILGSLDDLEALGIDTGKPAALKESAHA